MILAKFKAAKREGCKEGKDENRGDGGGVPNWEESPHTPLFSQKSAQAIGEKEVEVKKEVYGKWKSAEWAENKEVASTSP